MTYEFILRIFVAAILGGIVGLEREYRDKAAGFRTHFLVALGSALFMILSAYGFEHALVSSEHRLDVSRIAAQVVSGIGFLGAGTIIFQKNVVRGLTTAAGVWVVAAIGLACGATDAFIRQHAGEDVRQLALRGTKDPEVDLSYALDQIAGRQKARTKLPSWAKIDEIVYPSHLSMEQCSSEYTALYKKKIVERLIGERQLFVDLTGGFGVDFAFIATLFQQAVYVERQEALCSLSSHNFRVLGLTQAQTRCGDGMDYLTTVSHADVIMIDPARRDEHGGRTFAITDCTPNILESLNQLLEKSDYTLVKLSPMLDWQKAVEDIGEQWVREVHIVSVGNECKAPL